jgi:hypothetical protein
MRRGDQTVAQTVGRIERSPERRADKAGRGADNHRNDGENQQSVFGLFLRPISRAGLVHERVLRRRGVET